ncbi:peroxidase family protein [Rhodopirellula bahusiensis]|nr:peroxidase family protein [Rhodopirellula bahusiensis]
MKKRTRRQSAKSRRSSIERLEARNLLASDWTNPVVWEDVNSDGRISALDALNVINQINREGLNEDLSSVRPASERYFYDVNGDARLTAADALWVINALNRNSTIPVELRESEDSLGLSDVKTLRISIGESAQQTRKYRFRLDTFWGDQSASNVLDSVSVYLVSENASDLNDESTTDRSLLTVTPRGIASGNERVRFDGNVVEVDLSSAGDLQGALLEFRPLWAGNLSSRVVVTPLTNEVRSANLVSAAYSPNFAVQPGQATDTTVLQSKETFAISLQDVSFDRDLETTSVTLSIKNEGSAIGAGSVLTFQNLPTGVEVLNRSGITSDGLPYVSLRNAIPSGWLGKNATTLPITVNLTGVRTRFGKTRIGLLATGENQAPTVSSIPPREVAIGSTGRINIAASDANGDLLSYVMRDRDGLTAVTISGTELIVRPEPGDQGTYEIVVAVSDGLLSTEQKIEINVPELTEGDTRIAGTVLGIDGSPLAGVPIELGGYFDTTDESGRFEIALPTMLVPTARFDIAIPVGDVQFDPFNTGTQTIPFRRARHEPGTGTDLANPRLHPNLVSSFLDASVVYGSDEARATALRTLSGGKLKMDAGNLLPANTDENFPDGPLENDNEGRSDPSTLFSTGDTRANENVALLSLHTVLVREHNRLTDLFAAENPAANDETLYQRARQVVGGLLQQITYSEYLPALLGQDAIAPYDGYDPEVNPSQSALFAVAAFRLGHSQVFSELERLDTDGNSLPGGPIALKDAFFSTDPIRLDGIDPFLRGLVQSRAESIDPFVIDDLRNFLFGPPGSGGMDLAAMNIQRGRDMGLPSYNQARIDFGLAPAATFDEISSDSSIVSSLQNTYQSVDDVDVWVGGLSEDHVAGGATGELFSRIIADQFQRARDGDRFWFQNGVFNESDLDLIQQTTLAGLIERNTEISGLPDSVLTPDLSTKMELGDGTASDTLISEYRTFSGVGNNQTQPELGAVGTPLVQNHSLGYSDGFNSPAGENAPNPRTISNNVQADRGASASASLSGMMVYWGQLIDHDLGLTPGGVSDTLKIFGDLKEGTDSYPFVAERLGLVLGHDAYVGALNEIERPIYLPVLDMANSVTVDPNAMTMVTTANIPMAELGIAAGTLKNRQGQLFSGNISITEVPRDLTPASLPDNLIPEMVVTIQPADMVFETPAPLSLPNTAGYEPGAIVDLYSINPTTGEFDDVGDGVVSADGLQITTTSGGVRNSSWHFFCPPNPDSSNNPQNPHPGCPTCPSATGTASSDVEFQTGALIETHDLVSYNSLGVQRGVSLVYDSIRADPRPVIHFGFDRVASNFPEVFLTGRVDSAAFTSGGIGTVDNGLLPGENIWAIPDGQTTARGAIQLDLRNLRTGTYQYTTYPRLLVGDDGRFRNVVNTEFQSILTHVNTRESVFGAGWGVSGLREAKLDWRSAGGGGGGGGITAYFLDNVLIVDGDGGEILYQRDPSKENQFKSFASGDYSTLTQEGLNSLVHRMKNGTTYRYEFVFGENRSGRPETLQLISMTDRNGNTTSYRYDNGIGITEIVDPVGLSTTFVYVGDHVASITDPAGRTTKLSVENNGLTSIEDPDTTVRTWSYDELGHMVSETTKRGFEQQAFFDFSGRTYQAIREDGQLIEYQPLQTIGLLPPDQTRNFTNPPNAFERLSEATVPYVDGNGNLIETVVDGRGQSTEERDSVGNVRRITRNEENQVSNVIDGRGNLTEYRYDNLGNVVEIIDEVVSGAVAFEASISWTGAIDNQWNNPLNWNEERVPTSVDRVLIRRTNEAIGSVVVGQAPVNVDALDSSLPITIDGVALTLRGQSRLQDDLGVVAGGQLVVTGNDSDLIVLGQISDDEGEIIARDGATIEFISVDKIIDADGSIALGIRAIGSESSVKFSNLTSIAAIPRRLTISALEGGAVDLGSIEAPVGLQLEASNSGVINLARATSLIGGGISISGGTINGIESLERISDTNISISAGSVLELPLLLSTFEEGGATSQSRFDISEAATLIFRSLESSSYISASLRTGGEVQAPELLEANNFFFDVQGDSRFDAPKLTRATRGEVRFQNVNAFPIAQISDFDYSTVRVRDISVTMPLLTSYAEPDSLAGMSAFQVTGEGAELSLPALATFIDSGAGQAATTFLAEDGGTLNIPLLIQSNTARFEARRGGTIRLPELVAFNNSNVIVASESAIETPKLETFTSGFLQLTGSGQFPSERITGLDFASVHVTDKVVSFPLITSYLEPNQLAGMSSLRVSGENAELSLPELATFVDSGAGQAVTTFLAEDGGTLSIPLLTQSNTATFEARRNGVVQLPELTNFDRSTVSISDGGVFEAPMVESIESGTVTVVGDVTFPFDQITSLNDTLVNVRGGQVSLPQISTVTTASFRLSNSGMVTLPELVDFRGSEVIVSDGSAFEADKLETLSGTLEIFGSGLFPTSQLTDIDQASIKATDAAVSFPLITSYQESGNPFGGSIRAIGVSTTLSFPALANIIDSPVAGTVFSAEQGGLLELPRLTSSNTASLRAQGGGKIDLPTLTIVENSDVIVGDGSLFVAPLLTTLTGSLAITGSGQFPTNQISNIDEATITVVDAVVSFPLITSYVESGRPFGGSVRVSGLSASLSFPALESIVDSPVAGTVFSADQGGVLELPLLISSNTAGLRAQNGGTVEAPKLTTIENSEVIVGDGSIFMAESLRSVTGRLSITGSAAFPASQVTSVGNTAVTVLDSSVVFSGLTTVELNGTNRLEFQATGQEALLSFPNLITLSVGDAGTSSFAFSANNGASLRLASFVNADADRVRFNLTNNSRAALLSLADTAGIELNSDATSEFFFDEPPNGEGEFLNQSTFFSASELAGSVTAAEGEDDEEPTEPQTVFSRTFRYDPIFNQMVYESDGLGRQTLYQIDPRNGNVLSVTNEVGSQRSFPEDTSIAIDVSGADYRYIDFDGDQSRELAFTSGTQLFVGTETDGTVDALVAFESEDAITSFSEGDFNQDGLQDVAIATRTSASVLLRTASGGFEELSILADSDELVSMAALEDLDGDGVDELVVGQRAFDPNSRTFGTQLDFYRRSGNETILAGGYLEEFTQNGPVSSIKAGDFDRDGERDLLLLVTQLVDERGSSLSFLRVAWGTSTLQYEGDGFLGQTNTAARMEFELIDSDLDGNLELVSPTLRNVEINSDRSLDYLQVADVDRFLTDLSLADLNDDGRLDIIGIVRGDNATQRLDQQPGNLVIRLSAADGGFLNPFSVAVGDDPRNVFVEDFDNDGRLDIRTRHKANDADSSELHTIFAAHERFFGAIGDSDDQITRYSYTPQGLVDTMTDPFGRVMDYDYDQFGRLITTTMAKGTPDEVVYRNEYDQSKVGGRAGMPTATIDANGNRTEFDYLAMNPVERISEADPDGDGPLTSPETTFFYDEELNMTLVVDPLGHETRYEFDERDRQVTVIEADPDGDGPLEQPITRYEYDGNDNLTSTTDPLGNGSQNEYDARNRLVKSIDPDGGGIRYEYDLDNNLIALIDPVGNRTEFVYDSRDRLVSEVDPLGAITQYRYDGANNLIEKVDRNGRVTQFHYDDLDRLVTENWLVGEEIVNTITSVYDIVGNLESITDVYSDLTFTYDSLDRVKSVDNAGTPEAPNVLLEYTYDGNGNVLTVIDTIEGEAGATTSYAYDGLDRLATLQQTGTDVADKLVDFSYNAIAQYTGIQRYSDTVRSQLSVQSSYLYDSLNRLKNLSHDNASGERLSFFDFRYDVASRITRIEDVHGVTDYQFDDRDQLTAAERSDSDARGDEAFVFDANGNRVSSELHGDGYVTGDSNRLLSDGTFSYEYDDEGNTVKRIEIATGNYRIFEWDHRNRLLALNDFMGNGILYQEIKFNYDAMNRRITKVVRVSPNSEFEESTIFFIYDVENVIIDLTLSSNSGEIATFEESVRYLHGIDTDQVISQETAKLSANIRLDWLLTDQLGTIQAIASANGTEVSTFRYDAFGNRKDDESQIGRYGFTGREIDEESGMIYSRSRYLNPVVGRFFSEDTIGFEGLDANLYRYVTNSPLQYVDADGKLPRIFSGEGFDVFANTAGDTASPGSRVEHGPRHVDIKHKDGITKVKVDDLSKMGAGDRLDGKKIPANVRKKIKNASDSIIGEFDKQIRWPNQAGKISLKCLRFLGFVGAVVDIMTPQTLQCIPEEGCNPENN